LILYSTAQVASAAAEALVSRDHEGQAWVLPDGQLRSVKWFDGMVRGRPADVIIIIISNL